jgi:vitamin K-dependent gamma-carboxylase
VRGVGAQNSAGGAGAGEPAGEAAGRTKAWGRSVDGASLAAFRVLFGAVMLALVLRFVAKGWVTTQLTGPSYHFTYELFLFVRPWPALGMQLHFAILAIAAACIALGFFHRTSAAVFFVGFSYVELIDKATYLNHYYLDSLLSALLVVLPAASTFSVDAWRRSELRTNAVPAWTVWALRLQLGVVYVFAGIAKLNADWLFRAEPLRIWLSARSDLPVIGPLLALEWTAYAASWLGAAFDLTIVGFLLFPRTRSFAFFVLVVFHVATGLLLPIGMFPWIMIAGATIFLDPGWPKRWLARFGIARGRGEGRVARVPWPLAALVAVHCLVQVIVPLRGLFDATASEWSLRGFNFAWKVMIAEKAGAASFRVRDRESGETTRVDPKTYLTATQERAMVQDPDMIRARAVRIARDFVARRSDVAVFSDAFASLNGRASARMLDPDVDLTRSLPAGWILSAPEP